jgi:hypothetical protein
MILIPALLPYGPMELSTINGTDLDISNCLSTDEMALDTRKEKEAFPMSLSRTCH